MSVLNIKLAESPAKTDMLELLDRLRSEVEHGEVVALAVIPVHPDAQFSVRSAGAIQPSSLTGYFFRCAMDAAELMEQGS